MTALTTSTQRYKVLQHHVVSGAETPAYQNSYGWYYKAGSDDVYGTANGFNVLHDSTGYYYTDGSGTRQDVTSSEFTAITTTAVKPESPTAPLDRRACRPSHPLKRTAWPA